MRWKTKEPSDNPVYTHKLWFAWYPVEVHKRNWVWLERINRDREIRYGKIWRTWYSYISKPKEE